MSTRADNATARPGISRGTPYFCPNEHYKFRGQKIFATFRAMNQETPDTTLGLSNVNHLERLYDGWFLDYASYVILDRAVPYFEDGYNGAL